MVLERRQYEIAPEPFWRRASLYGDGYDVMEQAGKRGWHAVAAWGQDGYDLGSWPYVIFFFRDREGQYDLLYYVEGDVTMYSCPTQDIRNVIVDELAFFHWKYQGERWVEEFASIDQLPDTLRGPYRAR
jgi:hypothetical protein